MIFCIEIGFALNIMYSDIMYIWCIVYTMYSDIIKFPFNINLTLFSSRLSYENW